MSLSPEELINSNRGIINSISRWTPGNQRINQVPIRSQHASPTWLASAAMTDCIISLLNTRHPVNQITCDIFGSQ